MTRDTALLSNDTCCGSPTVLGAVGLLWALSCGCAAQPQALAAEYLPAGAEVVEAYGLTLDHQATPEHTAFALLMAIRDDTRSAVGSAGREQALKLQCRLADPGLLRTMLRENTEAPPGDIDAFIFELIRNWGAMLNYYAEYFADDFEAARQHMETRAVANVSLPEGRSDATLVRYVLAAGDGTDRPRRGATVTMGLSRSQEGHWRVYNVRVGPPPTRSNTQPPNTERHDDPEESS